MTVLEVFQQRRRGLLAREATGAGERTSDDREVSCEPSTIHLDPPWTRRRGRVETWLRACVLRACLRTRGARSSGMSSTQQSTGRT